jgi:hypothetical protein
MPRWYGLNSPQSLNDAANGFKHRPDQMHKPVKSNVETDLHGCRFPNV